MASNLINRLNFALSRFEQVVGYLLGNRFPPGALCTVDLGSSSLRPRENGNSGLAGNLKEIIGNGLLWAAPKKRRCLERRLSRKFGFPGLNWKPLVPKTNLLMCPTCGHHHESGLLCSKCYGRVKVETQEMQDAIFNNLELKPIEEEVVVIYEGEKEQQPSEFWKGQRIVEMPKKRPTWFHSNLLQPSTQEPAETKDVKPEELA